jgi:glycine hydroxymethyltransferase
MMGKDFESNGIKQIQKEKQNDVCTDLAVFPGNQGGPLMHIIAAKLLLVKAYKMNFYLCYAQFKKMLKQWLSIQKRGYDISEYRQSYDVD